MAEAKINNGLLLARPASASDHAPPVSFVRPAARHFGIDVR